MAIPFPPKTWDETTEDEILKVLHTGEEYLPFDERIFEIQKYYQALLDHFNTLGPYQTEERQAYLQYMFADLGEDCYIEPPFNANFGGKFVHFEDRVYANSNLTLVDDTHIYVGAGTQLGPNVTLATAMHPLNHERRAKGYQYNKPVRIGKNCWFGVGVVVQPGVTVGDNTIIGAGSVVTRDIPSNVLAFGTPCRVIRELA